jgi:hypothetical protein
VIHVEVRALQAFMILCALLVAGACRSQAELHPQDLDEPRRTVAEFVLEAFSPTGNLARAYELLDAKSRHVCPPGFLKEVASQVRPTIGFEELRLRSIKEQRRSSTEITFNVRAAQGDREAIAIPDSVTVVAEGEDWRVRIAHGATCPTWYEYLDVTPSRIVTPVFEGNSNCEKGYPFVCIPPYPPDLDCKDIPYRRFIAIDPDPHGLDTDGDMFGCNE